MCGSKMSGRLGLVSYTGDSEISDEDEVEHEPVGPAAAAVAVQGLGIPSSRSAAASLLVSTTPPPAFPPPVVQSAPLVAYAEEDDMNESRADDSVFSAAAPLEGEDRGRESGGEADVEGEAEPISALPPSLEVMDEASRSETEFDSTAEPPLFLPLNNAHLPPEPPGRCSKALQDKVTALLQKEQRLGLDLNKHLQGRKDFRNPSIYEKLVAALDLDEFGTNFPLHLYDPKTWGEESNYKNLLEAQKRAYEKKEKAKLQEHRTKIEFVKGTKRPGGGAGVSAEGAKKARRSKWDISTAADSSGGSKGSTPPGKLGEVGAQARAQATQINRELGKLASK